MKTRSWLYLSAAVMFGGLAILASLSIHSIYNIRGIVSQLTHRSTPLQIKTTELQRSIESLTGVLLRLGVANDKREVTELSSAVDDRLKTVQTALEGIKALDKEHAGAIDVTVINTVYNDVKRATDERIRSLDNFQQESRKVNDAIQSVEQSLGGVRRDMQTLNASGSKQVSTSVNSSVQIFTSAQQVKDVVITLKEVQVILKDLDAAKGTSEILANKSKLRSANTVIQAVTSTDPEVVEVKKSMEAIYQQVTKPDTGLVALKQAMLSGRDSGEKFQEEKRALNNRLLELIPGLTTAVGRMELRAEKNRKDVDSAMSTNQRIDGVGATINAATIATKSIDGKLRSLMLSEAAKDANTSAGELRSLFAQIGQNIIRGRKELALLKQTAALRNVDAASTSIHAAEASVERIIAAQMKIIESNDKAKKALEMVKVAADKELKTGEELVKNTADIQAKMVEKTNSVSARMSATIITMAIIIAVLAAIPLLYTIRRINSSLSRVTDMVRDIAEGEGDITKRLDEGGKDEFAVLSHWFNVFLNKLNAILQQVSSTTADVSAASSTLLDSSRQISKAAESVAAQGASAGTASEEMAATAADISNNCHTVADNSRSADDAAQSGAAVLRETLTVMGSIAEKVNRSAETVSTLGQRGDQIGAIVATIQDIADQTNLLALNAAIEAARAGEQGRGFAVVADEVRSLAERTTEATREIGEMIHGIQSDTQMAVRSMAEGVKQVEAGTEKASESGQALQLILEQIASLNLQISQIATAAEQQTATTIEINTAIQHMTDEVSVTANGAQHTTDAASKLSEQATTLSHLVGQFKLSM
ncbi:methyl-accepting chemotaxis sensory transducer, class 40H [Citrifermentans bemidjiense Bem]|uniref:Methyl-accepting chemotaxis sensory transducer, class 40H n=1 Tax=Citrifermentans bemidjiense (strain ATCC BAA-1014 / DSM 16622 / JCM 12645 / Bem) TaxID=404380 RepID=B5EE59_CITBB|nr:HAMP domain-containing methyl-accepting chemotaxis protein [Citrifermentans bemidjiense]ACH37797.1 methyl-accepting chemotaxis sensory transducer, class 40H [Citrifermentans bemidjiense Bem]